MREIPPFTLMHWAKDSLEGAPYPLGASGVAPADLDALPEVDPPGPAASSEGDRFGFAPLRAAIAAAWGVPDDGVLVSDGTSLANFAALAALAGPGARVLVETPTYDSLAGIPALLGAAVERLPRRPEAGWLPDLGEVRGAARRRPRLAAVVLTRLHNPSGADLPGEWLGELAALAEEEDFRVLLDEVYLDFGDAPTGARRSPRFLATGSLTKVYGLGGLRIGWVLGDPAPLAAVRELSFYLSVNASAPSQALALRALAARATLRARARTIAARGRPILEEWIAARGDVEWVPPAGGINAFLRLTRVADTRGFCARLREERGVAIAAGEHFGAPGWVRVSFGAEEPVLRAGLAELGRALDAAGAGR